MKRVKQQLKRVYLPVIEAPFLSLAPDEMVEYWQEIADSIPKKHRRMGLVDIFIFNKELKAKYEDT